MTKLWPVTNKCWHRALVYNFCRISTTSTRSHLDKTIQSRLIEFCQCDSTCKDSTDRTELVFVVSLQLHSDNLHSEICSRLRGTAILNCEGTTRVWWKHVKQMSRYAGCILNPFFRYCRNLACRHQCLVILCLIFECRPKQVELLRSLWKMLACKSIQSVCGTCCASCVWLSFSKWLIAHCGHVIPIQFTYVCMSYPSIFGYIQVRIHVRRF